MMTVAIIPVAGRAALAARLSRSKAVAIPIAGFLLWGDAAGRGAASLRTPSGSELVRHESTNERRSGIRSEGIQAGRSRQT